MSVYINMEMPKEGFVEILIRDDGTVQQTGQSYRINGTDYYTPYVGEMPVMYKAIEVTEPHGRLIDADAFVKKCEEMADKEDGNQLDALILLRWFLEQNAPTIIPASEEVST